MIRDTIKLLESCGQIVHQNTRIPHMFRILPKYSQVSNFTQISSTVVNVVKKRDINVSFLMVIRGKSRTYPTL